ncbi:MAG: serine/threonine protein kinase [Deltaproteobacteria bacterium]|nr:serine/threonine protein kinase [Deltaproteobacteria bacterium]
MGSLGANAPARLGRYELLARLATGGMGEIFLARLEGAAGFEKLFVVKRILPHLADDARFRAMMIGEARIASKMAHPHICQVYELGETDGQLYIVMEYLEGVALLPLLRKASKEAHPLDLGFVAGVVQQVSDGLHYAHELRDRSGESMGIVHRDVTPGNIFLTDAGVAKVLDFGIAKVKDASANTQTGTVKGKYAYMAPEQLRGGAVDRRADVFALGVVIYEMLALRRLFQRKTDYLTFRAAMEQPIPDVRRYRPDVPDALAAVIERALDRDPTKRHESARALGTAVLDTMAPARPWTQGELGDFVHANFADHIGRRSQQVASAIQRTNPAGAPRAQIAPTEGAPLDDDDEDSEFPPVDSVVVDQAPASPSDFAGHTPPPFAGDSHPSLQPIVGGGPKPVVIVAKRSVVWPLIAVAMVLIAGGALFLVWKQMQAAPPAVVNITTERAEQEVITPPPSPTPPAPGSAAPATPLPGPGSAAKVAPPRPKTNPYTDAIRTQQGAMNRCANDHGRPPAGARVTLTIGTGGKARSIAFEPASLDGTPLASCIRTVLTPTPFPRASEEKTVSFTLTAST